MVVHQVAYRRSRARMAKCGSTEGEMSAFGATCVDCAVSGAWPSHETQIAGGFTSSGSVRAPFDKLIGFRR